MIQRCSQKVRQNQGAISIYILLILLVTFLLLPIYVITLEKAAAQNNIDKIQDTITISVTSSYMALMPEFYTDAEIRLDPDAFQQRFHALLMDNLATEYPGITIEEEEIFVDGLPLACPKGMLFERPGVHVVVRVPIVYAALRFLIPGNQETAASMTVHGDVLFTVDNE
ncbi:MAG: hypothetical protein WCL54_08370 [Clostridia bacterium]